MKSGNNTWVAVVTFDDTHPMAPSSGKEYHYFFNPFDMPGDLEPGNKAVVHDGAGAGKTVTIVRCYKADSVSYAPASRWLNGPATRKLWERERQAQAAGTTPWAEWQDLADIIVIQLVSDPSFYERVGSYVTTFGHYSDSAKLGEYKRLLDCAQDPNASQFLGCVYDVMNLITQFRNETLLKGLNTPARKYRYVRRFVTAGVLRYYSDITGIEKLLRPRTEAPTLVDPKLSACDFAQLEERVFASTNTGDNPQLKFYMAGLAGLQGSDMPINLVTLGPDNFQDCPMNMQPIRVVTKTFISGGALLAGEHEVGSLTDAEIIRQVRAIEKEIADLDKIENKAEKVVKRILELKTSIEQLNKILDDRPDTPAK